MSSPATASVADMSRNVSTSENVNSAHNNSGVSAAQCTPLPLPALGIQRIIQGNGTAVGTVISLQCPARHRLMGEHMECVMGPNVAQWKGETYCKPLSIHEDYGFRVAVVASIVSSAIILLMSMAFITCCVVGCLNRGKKRHQERCHQRDPCGGLISAPSSPYTLAPTPPAIPLPGHGYNQPLLSQSSSSDPAQRSISSQQQHSAGPYWASCQTQNSALVQSSAPLVGRAVS